MPEAFKLRSGERLSEDVRGVVVSSDRDDLQFTKFDEFAGDVKFDAKVSNLLVPALVFSELLRGLIVTMKGGGIKDRHMKTVKELA